MWDAFALLQLTGPTSVVPKWWTRNKCESYFAKYWNLSKEEQIGRPFLPGDPQGDDMHGRPAPAAQAIASEMVSDIQIQQDAAQARQLQDYFDQVDRAQAESDEELDDGAPVTLPPVLLPEPPAYTRPTFTMSYQLLMLSGWGHGFAQHPLSFASPGLCSIVPTPTAIVDQSNIHPGAHSRSPTELEESTIKIIEMPSHPHSPEALTFASLLAQQSSSTTSPTMTSSVPLPMVLQSSTVCHCTSVIVGNNSPFYSHVGYLVSQVLPTSAHLHNIAYVNHCTHHLGTIA